MRWIVVALLLTGLGVGIALQTNPNLIAKLSPEPVKPNDRALFACSEAMKDVLKAPDSFKVISEAAHVDEGEGQHLDYPAKLTQTIFEFTAKNPYGVDLKSVGSCQFAWPIVGSQQIEKPSFLSMSIDGKVPDELTLMAVSAKLVTLKHPGD